ncbi:hypothetical protein GF371_04365 [Candidatus Woesearchaeota archaeon]|nr:hypothetical protein [Candidatus Woesearchaeota archaeon]
MRKLDKNYSYRQGQGLSETVVSTKLENYNPLFRYTEKRKIKKRHPLANSRIYQRIQMLKQYGVFGLVQEHLRTASTVRERLDIIKHSVPYLLSVGELQELEARGTTGRKYGVHILTNGRSLREMPGYWDASDSILYPDKETASLDDKIFPPERRDVARERGRRVRRKRSTARIHKTLFKMVNSGT